MTEEQNTNHPKMEQTEEQRLRDVRERMGKTFVNKTEPGKGVAIIGGVRHTPRREKKGES